MNNETSRLLTGCILEEEHELTLGELCRACTVQADYIIELVDAGVLEPAGRDASRWRFEGASLRRARIALRLQHDLDINYAGAALILDMLDEVENLRAQLNRMS